MAHFVKCDSNGHSFFACVEERSAFGFSNRGHDIAHDCGSDENNNNNKFYLYPATVVRIQSQLPVNDYDGSWCE